MLGALPAYSERLDNRPVLQLFILSPLNLDLVPLPRLDRLSRECRSLRASFGRGLDRVPWVETKGIGVVSVLRRTCPWGRMG